MIWVEVREMADERTLNQDSRILSDVKNEARRQRMRVGYWNS